MENSPKENSQEKNLQEERPRRIGRLTREASKALGKKFLEGQKQRKLEEQQKNADEALRLKAMGAPFSILPIWEKEEYSFSEENDVTTAGLEKFYAKRKLKTKRDKKILTEHVSKKNAENTNENTYHAKGLEYAFVAMAGKEWLCPPKDSELEAYSSSEYDDMCGNRIDSVVILKSPDGENIIFGIDLYSEDSKEKKDQTLSEENGREWHRVKKILQSNNDRNFDGPIGFSKINSYQKRFTEKLNAGNALVDEPTNNGADDKSILVPRFVLGIDRDEIDSLLGSFKDGQYDLRKLRSEPIQRPLAPFEHYAILQELIDQTELFAKIQKESDSEKNADSIKLLEKLDTTFKQMRSNLYESMFDDTMMGSKEDQKAKLEQLLAEHYPDDDKHTAMSKLIAKYKKDRVFTSLTEVTSTLKRYDPGQIDDIKEECKKKEHKESYQALARAALKARDIAS